MIEFTINHQGEILTIPIEEEALDFKDGYCSIYFNIYGFYYSGVIDENFQIVIPFVYTNKQQEFSVTTIFKNHKAIYGIKNEEFYLIDLEQVQFQKQNKCLVPINYIMKFDAYNDLDDEKAILMNKGKYFLYDVVKEEKLSIDFEYMDSYNDVLSGCLFLVPDINIRTVLLNCTLNKEGQIQNPLSLENLSIWLNKEYLQEKETILEETAKIYRKEFLEKGGYTTLLH